MFSDRDFGALILKINVFQMLIVLWRTLSRNSDGVLDQLRRQRSHVRIVSGAPFIRFGLSGREDAGSQLAKHMDHHEHPRFRHADEDIAILTLGLPVIDQLDRKWIAENIARVFEGDSMLFRVCGRLSIIPFERIIFHDIRFTRSLSRRPPPHGTSALRGAVTNFTGIFYKTVLTVLCRTPVTAEDRRTSWAQAHAFHGRALRGSAPSDKARSQHVEQIQHRHGQAGHDRTQPEAHPLKMRAPGRGRFRLHVAGRLLQQAHRIGQAAQRRPAG